MKAKEYAAWYETNIKECGEDISKVENLLKTLYGMFFNEYKVLSEARHISTGPGQAGILRELDDKCRAMVDILQKKDIAVVQPNFFKVTFLHNNPAFIQHFK